jgi:hypothetical protein
VPRGFKFVEKKRDDSKNELTNFKKYSLEPVGQFEMKEPETINTHLCCNNL